MAAASGIQSLGLGNALFNAVLSQSILSARQSFDATSGEIHASAFTAAIEDSRFVREAILDRLSDPQGTVANAKSGVPAPYAFWGQAFGDFGRNKGDGNAATLRRSTGGFVLGGDVLAYGPWRIGAAGGYTTDSLKVSTRASSGKFTSVYGALYAGANYGAVDLKLGAVYSGNHTSVSRNISLINFADATSTGYGGRTTQGFGEIGYHFAFAQGDFEPILNAAVISAHQDSFRETGGAAALTGAGRTRTVETTTLGVRAKFAPFASVPMTLSGLLGWRHGFGDTRPTALLAFVAPSTSFTVNGAPVARDAAAVQALLDWRATSQLTVGVSYSGQIASKVQDHAFKANLLYKF